MNALPTSRKQKMADTKWLSPMETAIVIITNMVPVAG
jgi:hypothetical protein